MNNLSEEIRYWESISESGKNSVEKNSAKSVKEILRTVEDDLRYALHI